jgi:adenylate kinase family enzyme
MKRLIFISGTMGVGKTTISEILLKELNNSVFLDGDWCWNINPFIANDENKNMVMKNICFLLNSFINNSNIENIIFCWVMNKQEIIDTLISKIGKYDEFYHFTLMITPELLRKHFNDDIEAGKREINDVEKAIEYINDYNLINSIKIEVKENNIMEIVNEIKSRMNVLTG